MKFVLRRSLFVLCLVALVAAPGAHAAKKNKKPASEPAAKAPSVRVERFLRLGPVLDPLPVFHDGKPGTFGLAERLKADVFPNAPWTPTEGGSVSWFGGRDMTWTAGSVAKDGSVPLEPPAEAGAGRPAAAWLAAYLEVDRFQAATLRLEGAHPRRAWLDGREVASGGTGGADEEVKGDVELVTGKHLLVVETLWDASRSAKPWQVGVELAAKDEDAPRPEVRVSLDPARTITIHDVLDPPAIDSLAVSHDGDFVAVTLERYWPGTDTRETWLEVWAAGRMYVWRGGSGIGQVAWGPRKGLLSYVTSEGEGDERRTTLWVVNVMSHVSTPLLERVEDFVGYRWSPDGRTIAYLTSVEPEKDERGIKRLEGLMDRWSYHRTKRYLNLVTWPGGVRRRLTAGPLSTDGIAFSPDGGRLLFTRSVEDFAERPFIATELWELDLGSFESRQLRRSRWLNSAVYSPDGKRLLLLAGPDEFGDAGRNIPAGMIANNYDGQLFVWDPASDEVDAITRDFEPAVQRADWSRADGKIYLTAESRDYVRLYRYDPAERRFGAIDTKTDVLGGFTLAGGAPVAAGVGSGPWMPGKLIVIDLKRDLARQLIDPAHEWFKPIRRGTVEPWSFTASSGKQIDGRVYLPPGFDAQQKYPLIVYYYGGTSPVGRGFGGRYPKEYWASQGYVVYVLQPSGATGFGQAFSATHVNDWGKTTSEEIIEGTRRFLEAHPYVDAQRVGCIGASYGGFMTMLLSTKTDLFAAAVAHAGISSISSYWGEGYWGYSYSSVATANSYPWNRQDVYVDQSPLFRADQHRVPILLTHGAADTNVPVGESDQFYVALKLLGKDVEYLRVDAQDHWILDHAKRIVWSRSIVAWFDRWLKGQPEWWNSLYPPRE